MSEKVRVCIELSRSLYEGILKNPDNICNGVIYGAIRAGDVITDGPVQNNWIPCSERLPEEDYWLGGSGKQFSDEVLVSVVNYDDEDTWTYISQTIDGNWALELPKHCEIVAWQPLPEPYKEEKE